jgi:hypothetical protein
MYILVLDSFASGYSFSRSLVLYTLTVGTLTLDTSVLDTVSRSSSSIHSTKQLSKCFFSKQNTSAVIFIFN